ncbi:uncharacterized protein LOC134543175 [Bacillus rossius redtenbacheri]|uniref:uncharacterized protein LOC134543175 n=1 Tax=Bacillus rossius redtenbacheri TaxID=93214 RepID=UPI002FDD8D53
MAAVVQAVEPVAAADALSVDTLDTMDPMKEEFQDSSFNVYASGPGANLDSALQPCNRRATGTDRVYRLYINGLPQGLSKRGLTNIFYNYGVPFDVTICRGAESGHQFAFVSFRTEKEAEKAIRELHKKPPVHLRVEFARSEEDKARLLKEEAEKELICKILKDKGRYEEPSYTPKFPVRMSVAMPGYHHKRADYLADQAWCDGAVPRGAGFYRPYAETPSSNSSRVVLRYLRSDEEPRSGRAVALGRGFCRTSKCPVELPGRSCKFTKLAGSEDVWTCGREVPLQTGKCVRCAVDTPHHCKRCAAWYCSRDCQQDDWLQHKERCCQPSISTSSSVSNGPTSKGAASGGRGRGGLSVSLLQQLANISGAPECPETPAKPASQLEALLRPSRCDQFLPVCELSVALRLSRGSTGTGKMLRSYGQEFTALLDGSPEDVAAITRMHEEMMLGGCSSVPQNMLHEGDLVAVLPEATGTWSRGLVLEVRGAECVVALCDVGTVEVVADVRPLLDPYRSIPERVVTVSASRPYTLPFKKNTVFSYEVVSHEGSEATCVLTCESSGETHTVSVLPWQPLPEDAGLKTVSLEDGNPVVMSSFFDQQDLYLRPATKQNVLQYHIVLSATAAYAVLHGGVMDPRGPRVGEMVACQFSGDGIFYRALVVAVDGDSYTVAYVDFGNQEAVSLDKLRFLNPPLKQHPCFAVRVSLRDMPKTVLTSAAAKYLSQLVEQETVVRVETEGSVSEGVKLYHDKTCVNDVIQEHLQQRWRKELASDVPPASCGVDALRYVALPVGGTVALVVLSVLDREGEGGPTVAGCRADEEVILHVYRTLLREINLYAYHSKAKMFVPRVGDACVAKNSDDVWHRALCVELKRDEVVVMLVDVGTVIRIPYYHVRSIPAEFTDVPVLGLLCRFQGMAADKQKLLTPHSVHTVRVVSHLEDEYLVELIEAN